MGTTMSEYTPGTIWVRQAWIDYRLKPDVVPDVVPADALVDALGDEFDRWLEGVIAEVIGRSFENGLIVGREQGEAKLADADLAAEFAERDTAEAWRVAAEQTALERGRAERAESKLTLLSGIAMRMAAHVEAKYDDDSGLDDLVQELRAALYRAGA